MARKLISIAILTAIVGSVSAAEPELISVKQGTFTAKPGDSWNPALSGDGHLVAFESMARLTRDDTNKNSDIYLCDRRTHSLRRVHADDERRTNGSPSISGDGCWLMFHSYPYWTLKMKIPRTSEIYVLELDGNTMTMPLTEALGKTPDGESINPIAGPDGSLALFTSNGTVLDPVASSGLPQVYMLDRRKPRIKLMSVRSDGVATNRICGNPRMSEDGVIVAFLSAATNLEPELPLDSLAFHLYVRNRSTGKITRADTFEKGFDPNEWVTGGFDMDASGHWIVFEARHRNLEEPSKTLEAVDLFLYDSDEDKVKILTTGMFANKARNPSMSADGRFIAFIYKDTGLVIYDRDHDRWERVIDGRCTNPVLSRDGRALAYVQEDKKAKNIYVINNPLFEATKTNGGD